MTTLFDIAEVDRARDAAMQQVAQHAEEHEPNFGERAEAFVIDYLRRNGATAGEVITLACKRSGIAPHDDRAFGPVYHKLARHGVISKVGTVRRERGHGTAGGNVWSLNGASE